MFAKFIKNIGISILLRNYLDLYFVHITYIIYLTNSNLKQTFLKHYKLHLFRNTLTIDSPIVTLIILFKICAMKKK